MDLKTLEVLGISAEDLKEKIIQRAVDALLTTSGFDPECGQEVSYESNFKREILNRIQKAVDRKISEIYEEYLLPKVGELIERSSMTETNRFGEPTSAPMTFKEYLAHRAETYMMEPVNYAGYSQSDLSAKGSSTYNWKASGPRLVVLMKLHIRESLESTARAALSEVNKAIAKSMTEAAQRAIMDTASTVKLSVSAS